MTRMSLASICVVASLLSLGCHSTPEAAAPSEEPTAVTTGDTRPADAGLSLIEPEDKITDRRAVVSRYTTLEGRRVLRLKTDRVTISVNIQDVIEYLEEHSTAHPNLTDEKALADKLRSERGARSEYRYEDLLPAERDRMYFCVAALLEKGRFLIVLNDTGERVPQILACKYSQIRGPMDGYAGRVFLLDDEREFFRTMDRIY